MNLHLFFVMEGHKKLRTLDLVTQDSNTYRIKKEKKNEVCTCLLMYSKENVYWMS